MELRSTFLLMAAVAFSTNLAAQTTQASASQPPKKALDPNEVVCQKQEVLGSRLATKKVCMTRAQWADQKAQDRQDIEKVQVNRGMRDH